MSSPVKKLLVGAVKCYRRWISPAIPGSCRFAPTCSAYAIQAVERHGPLKGTTLTAGRLLRCHPFHPGGYDPVPEKTPETGKRGSGDWISDLARTSANVDQDDLNRGPAGNRERVDGAGFSISPSPTPPVPVSDGRKGLLSAVRTKHHG